MPILSQSSAQAIARLRAYTPPPTQYHNLALSRRAAVLILLFADRTGELRVVLTTRAKTLNSYAGQVALPGGKADTLSETPFETARREAHEEIGLPAPPAVLPPPFAVEHLCTLPMSLAKTELGVMPCVAFLSASTTSTATPTSSATEAAAMDELNPPSVEDSLIPRLDAREVAAVFTAPLGDFLRTRRRDDSPSPSSTTTTFSSANLDTDPEDTHRSSSSHRRRKAPHPWYRGVWTDWHGTKWRMHNFYVPAATSRVHSRPSASATPTTTSYSLLSPPHLLPTGDVAPSRYSLRPRNPAPGSSARPPKPDLYEVPEEEEEDPHFRVFGMTARILVDCARVAFGAEPAFEHNTHLGDEGMVRALLESGRLSGERVKGSELGGEEVAAARAKGGEVGKGGGWSKI